MAELFTVQALSALAQVIMIDLVLAGDNAIVIGLAAAGLPAQQRSKAILIGIGAATVLRIGFAAVTTQLLQLVGLLLAGGILLLWVCWKMWRELRAQHAAADSDEAFDVDVNPTARPPSGSAQDACAGDLADHHRRRLDVARQRARGRRRRARASLHPHLRACAVDRADGHRGELHRRLLQNHRWIAYVGLAVILYVAVEMIYRGWNEVLPHVAALTGPL